MKQKSSNILDNLKPQEWNYSLHVRRRADDCRKVLSQLISLHEGLAFQKELTREYFLKEKGYPPQSCYPNWAYQLAFTLYDPNQIFSNEVKRILSCHCKTLLDEFGQDEKPITSFLKNQTNILAEIAIDLDYMSVDLALN